jgi:beta-lactamase class A
MPDRRPYASRGVPRRATTRRSGGRPPIVRWLAIVAGLCSALTLGVMWAANPFGADRDGTPAAALGRASAALGGGGAFGAGPTVAGAANGSELQMADVAAPAATARAGQGDRPNAAATGVAVPTLRRWDDAAPGVVLDAALVTRLDAVLAGLDGHVSLAIKDLGSGRGAVLEGDRELPAASLYKLPILYTVFDAGLSLSEALPITEDARAYDTGTMELGVGESLTVAEALERMITLSDNTSAVMLGSRVGGPRINGTLAALGMDTTHYSLERMTTSALDMLHLLDLMARGRAVSPAASADMVHLLLRQRVNDRLPRLVPDDVQVAHKTGNLPGTVNDVGLLYSPSSTVAIAALVSDTTDETAAATAIARAAQVANAYFDEQPEVASRPTLPRQPARAIPPVWREPRPVPTVTPTAEATDVAGDAADLAAVRGGAGTPGARGTSGAGAPGTSGAGATGTPGPGTPAVPAVAVATQAATLAPTAVPATPVPTVRPAAPPAPTATPVPAAPPPTPSPQPAPPSPQPAPTKAPTARPPTLGPTAVPGRR